ncbi:MAG TPA: hypothetical protein VGG74_19390 [Kofleriaceae bacterium]
MKEIEMQIIAVERAAFVEMRRRARLLERMADYLPPDVIAAEVASKLAREIAATIDEIESRAAIVRGDEFLVVR